VKLGLIDSAWLGTPWQGRPGLEKAKEIGFDTIDVYSDPLELSDAERQVGLPVRAVSCAALGLADPHRAVQRFHATRAKAHADLAAELGARVLMFAHGEHFWEKQVLRPGAEWNSAVANTREIGEYAATRGVEMAVELEPFDLSLINSIDKMVAFLDEVGLPTVKANVDCSHLWLRRIDAAQIAELSGRIGHVHFSDCDGMIHADLPPGRGNAPLRSYLEALRDVGFEGSISLELEFPPEPAKAAEWVTEAYEATAALMREIGVRDGG
jgi:D-psicose/D-tagatose/L-ribulose 3-epimerase